MVQLLFWVFLESVWDSNGSGDSGAVCRIWPL